MKDLVFNKLAVEAHRQHYKDLFQQGAVSFEEYANECKRLMFFCLSLSIDIKEA